MILPEFTALAENPSSIASKGANTFGVPLGVFTNWRWQMKHQLRERKDFEAWMDLSLEESTSFEELEKIFNVGLSPYYASLILNENIPPLRYQVIPQSKELAISEWGQSDPLLEKSHSPVREVVHLYPDRVAFCVAMLCPIYCRYCYRKRRDEEEGLHFNRSIVEKGLAYIQSNPVIRDVLITGGDPFLTSDESLEHLVSKLRNIPHVEIIRFGTRTPVALPYRITKKLCETLAKFHPIWINTHFNHPSELTPDAQLALNMLANHGFPIGNQSVLLKGVNDSSEILKQLCLNLVKNRVRPYYIFHPHRIRGTDHFRVSVERGLKMMEELRGKITGFAIPQYIMDTPSGKIPLHSSYILGFEGQDLILRNVHGEIWREEGALTEG